MRKQKRHFTIELVERKELLNLRLISHTMARAIQQKGMKNENN